MAGGTFDLNVSKIRPGDYINYKSKRTQSPNGSTRGSVIIPLIGLGWGPDKTAVKLTAAAPDASMAQLGHSVYDNNDFMLMIREAFKNATTVTAYVLNHGTAATGTGGGITITATYGGTRGNDIAVASIADTDGTFTVRVYLDTDKVEEYTEISTIQSLIDASSGKYVKFSATDTSAAVTAFASVNLTGGTDGTVSNGDITAFLDASETIRWNTMCFPVTESTLQTAAITKVQYFRDSVGKYVQIVMPNCQADYEGVINVTNSVTVDDKDLTVAQACAWVAGATAAATKLTSLTQVPYVGASAVVSVKDNETAKAAIKVGEFFFSTTVDDTGNEIVVVEYDINSLHTFTKEKTKDYAKNRVIRVYDTFGEDLKLTFPSNKFDNEDDGWLVMEGLGRSLLQSYDDDGSIRNVDLDADFYVDQSRSVGDETYFNIGLQAVDSSEKLYFSVSTR